MNRRRALMAAIHTGGGNGLEFPITLVEGDNGQVGVDLFNYLSEKYSVGVNFTEELYFKGTSYSIFDGRITQIIGSEPNYLTLLPQNHLMAANIHLYSNGIVVLNIYG